MTDESTRERILDAAMLLLESGAPLTMRKLAADVGLAPTSIYWHVGNRAQLLHELVDRMIADMGRPRPRGSTPEARVSSIARWLRRAVLERPHLVTLAHEQGRSGALYFPVQTALACEVAAAGLHGEAAARAVRTVLFHVGGFVLLERSEFVRARPLTEEQWTEARWADAAAPDPELAGALAAPVDFDAAFDESLALLVRGVLAPWSEDAPAEGSPD
jgi:AcrR family transcriptional regulator